MNHHLIHVGLRVPDLAASIEHFEAVVGLREVSRTEQAARLALGDQPACVILTESDTAACDHMALGTTSGNLATIRDRAEAAAIEVLDAEFLQGDAIRLLAPNSLPVEIGVAEPAPKNTAPRKVGPVIGGLDHLSLKAADLPATVSFFCDVLGFRVSDSVDDARHWLRCGPNHHTVALFTGEDGLQHYAFDTAGIAELQRLCDLLATRGQNLLWGIGRHGLGANIFSYHLDPAGAILEICSDMIQVTDEDAWVTQTWPGNTLASALMWGPPPPSEFRQLMIPMAAGIHA
jgi:catechol 2,3-dioxygenase-like lactoylglutathione lyase family enzyme